VQVQPPSAPWRGKTVSRCVGVNRYFKRLRVLLEDRLWQSRHGRVALLIRFRKDFRVHGSPLG